MTAPGFGVRSPLEVLADPTRRRIFETVAHRGPISVGAIAVDLPVSRPAVSQHLRALRSAGLVTPRRAGNCQMYTTDPGGTAALRVWVDRFASAPRIQ